MGPSRSVKAAEAEAWRQGKMRSCSGGEARRPSCEPLSLLSSQGPSGRREGMWQEALTAG